MKVQAGWGPREGAYRGKLGSTLAAESKMVALNL